MKRLVWLSIASLSVCSFSVPSFAEESGNLIKFPLERVKESKEQESLETRKQQHDLETRALAYRELERMRVEQKIKHIGARYCDPNKPGRDCILKERDGPGDGPGPGSNGGKGGPGSDPNGCAWASVGPTNINGRVTNIAIDSANNQRIFVTTVGGIWRSSDGGRTWERVSEDFLATVFSSIVVNGSEVVAGGGDPNYGGGGNGIWRSTSNGDPGSWSKLSVTDFDNQTVWRLRLDPGNGDIYAAASNGVWLGTHSAGNLSFSRVGGFDARTNDIDIDWATTPRVIYAGVIGASATYAKGIWKRTSAGTWQERDTGITTGKIQNIALALAASSPSTLYAKISDNTNGRLLGVFKTTTSAEKPGSGNAWSTLAGAAVLDDSLFNPTSGYSWYNSIIEVDPSDPNRVYAGGVVIYRSTDGASFSSVEAGADASWPYSPHGDQHAIAFDPTNPKIVWLGNDGGLDQSTDTSSATWRWLDKSHGMVTTEFYRLASQQAMASLRAGGLQDNGTELTFGNRTWYEPGGCDGSTVAIDGVDPDTLYGKCNSNQLDEFVNPIPGWAAGPSTIAYTSPAPPVDPAVTDINIAGRALAQGNAPTDANGARTAPPILVKTTDGITWSQANSSQALTINQNITAIAIAPSSSFQTYYVGVTGGAFTRIWTTSNGGTSWNTASTGLPNATPSQITVDTTNPQRAFAAFESGTTGVWMTTNGIDWHAINGTGSTAWLPNANAHAIVIDPSNAETLYVASDVGFFRGTLSGSPANAAWTPMDEGLPDGLNVTGVWAGHNSGLLTISSMGHGVFQRDIRPDVTCKTKMLLVRDNVYDRGVGVSPSGMPDPEHPIADPARPGFFKPDDTDAGKVYWWSSPDIRIDVPDIDPPANTIANADHVEAETCPIEMSTCPAGTVWDNHPVRGKSAKAYVQVANQGIDPIKNVRVIALYADATSGLPTLPADFWTTTFPAGSTNCGALAGGSGWHLVDSAHPCKVVSVVNPAVPETARFDWNVPANQADHTCMLTITESSDDPLDPSIRSTNEVRPEVLIPNNRQIANRNLHVVDMASAPNGGNSGAAGMGVPWRRGIDGPINLSISRAGLPAKSQLGLLLPKGVVPKTRGMKQVAIKLTASESAKIRSLGVVETTAWLIPPDLKEIDIPNIVPHAGSTLNVAFYWNLGNVEKLSTWRISALARANNKILGGSVFYLRVGK